MTFAAVTFLLGVAVGMVGGDVWGFAVEMFDLYRQERDG